MIILVFLVFGFLTIFYLFSSRFSAIPFFPSNEKDLDLIVDFLDLKKDQTIIDLGAGTGTVVFAAAQIAHEKGLNTTFVAIDINPVLTAIMHIRRLIHPHRRYITIQTTDIFKMPYPPSADRSRHMTYYMYISPRFVAPLARKIKEAHAQATLVTYFYSLKGVPPHKHNKGIHDIYQYLI